MRYLRSTLLLLSLILVWGASLRFFNLNWDQGFHMHPDERAIVLATIKLTFPTSWADFVSPASSWNPHFFAYGSFPMYLLKLLGDLFAPLNPLFREYSQINLLGRAASALTDTATILILYFLGKKLHSKNGGLLAALLYATCVLPIQLSHFYAVDTLLTFFCALTLLLLLYFYEKPTPLKAVGVGISFAFALATKISAIVLLVSIGVTLIADILRYFAKHPLQHTQRQAHFLLFLRNFLTQMGIMLLTTVGVYFILQPYTFLSFAEFWKQTQEQSAMTKDAFTFPYTLQYVGKIPYLYEIKNIFFWGMGPFLALCAFFGTIYTSLLPLKKLKQNRWANELILLSFFWVYFLIVGHFAIGFMRYMLPLYPLLCLFGAIGLLDFATFILKPARYARFIQASLFFLFLLLLCLWPLSFLHIYTQPNTRVSATAWINAHIPPGSKLAIEHWDDALPLLGQEQYTLLTLPLYDPDTPEKWQGINQTLSEADYIIIASNRLSTPLQKLTDCARLPAFRCYKQTASYYHQLFAGQLGYSKVADFTSFPTIPFLNLAINDQKSDESFTVYDHPHIMIFRNEKQQR